MGDAVESDAMNERCLLVLVHKFTEDPAIEDCDPELVKSIVGTPWDPPSGREARVLDNEPLTATESIVPQAELRPRIPKQRKPETIPRRFYFRRDVELQLYGYTDRCVGCNAARDGRLAKQQSLECRDRIEYAILFEESDEVRKRCEESHRRRDAAGVPLEPRPGRPGEVAGESALPDGKRPREVTASDRQAKRSKSDARADAFRSGTWS